MGKLWDALVWLLSSKKRVAAVVAVLFAVLSPLFNKLGLDLSNEQVALVVGAISAYVVGQGIADIGKESQAVTTKKK